MNGSSSAPADALLLRESVSLLEAADAPSITKPDGTVIQLGYDGDGHRVPGGVFDSKGRVPIHVIRPGVGRGRGRHLYEAQMLAENSHKFTGWKMYLDHLAPEARKAAGGLPRGVRDLGGRLQETWWDPTVPASGEHGQGAVIGMARPVKFVRDLIDDDPELVEASISASATGVKPVMVGGQRAWLVEGIHDRGSVDWVTEAGAGGRVATALVHAYADERSVEHALVESMMPEEMDAYLQSRGRAVAGAGHTETPEGGDVSTITREALQEALSASPDILAEALKSNPHVGEFVTGLVESRMEEERALIEATAQARVDRAFELAAMEREAHSIISEAKLPDSWKTGLKQRYSLVENRPTDALDVWDEVDEYGNVQKSAATLLREAVEADIEKEREKLREASPTRVRALPPAPSSIEEGAEKPKAPQEKPYWAQILAEANIDPDTAYARQ